MAQGQEDLIALQQAGFSHEEIKTHKAEESALLRQGGFSEAEIKAHYGGKEFNEDHIKKIFKDNLDKNLKAPKDDTKIKPEVSSGASGSFEKQPGDAAGASGSFEGPPEDEEKPVVVREAKDFIEAFEAGFDMSVAGLMTEEPDMVLAENASMAMGIAQVAGITIGDIPSDFIGAVGGAGVGLITAGPPGAVVGSAAGSIGFSDALRKGLIDSYEQGEVDSFSEFITRSLGVGWAGLKGATIGLATLGAGKLAAKALSKTAAKSTSKVLSKTAEKATTKALATTGAELATMTAVGSALEGRIPEPEDFVNGAIMLGVFKGINKTITYGGSKTSKKLRDLYVRRDLSPENVVDMSKRDAKFKQQILSKNNHNPTGTDTGPAQIEPFPVRDTAFARKLKGSDLSPEIVSVLSNIGEKKGVRDTRSVVNKLLDKKNQMYQDWVDINDPLFRMEKLIKKKGVDIEFKDLASTKASLLPGTNSLASVWLKDYQFDYKDRNKITGKSYNEIINMADVDVTRAVLLARRTIEVDKRGIKTPVDINAARVTVENNKALDPMVKAHRKFGDNKIDYAVASGLLSPEAGAHMKEMGRDYVSLKRIVEFSTDDSVVMTKSGSKGGQFKKLKGDADLLIRDPILSTIEDVPDFMKMVHTNEFKQSLISLAEKGDIEGIKRVKTSVKPVKLDTKAMSKKTGIPETQLQTLEAFTSVNKGLTENQMAVMVKGKRQVWELTPEIAKIVNNMDQNQPATTMLFKISKRITGVKKVGITFTPQFQLKNTFRDGLFAFISTQSKRGFGPTAFAKHTWDAVVAAGDIYKRRDPYVNWLKSQSASNAFIDSTKMYQSLDIKGLQTKTNFLNTPVNVVKKAIEWAGLTATLSEQSFRLAEFKRVAGKSKDPNVLAHAALSSADLTLNFQRMGARVSASKILFSNHTNAFFNVRIQDLDKIIRMHTKNPLRTVVASTAAITVPSLLLEWSNKDDSRVQSAAPYIKALFWQIPSDDWQLSENNEHIDYINTDHADLVREIEGKMYVNKGIVWKVPKPGIMGILYGSVPAQIQRAFWEDNPRAYEGLSEQLLEQLAVLSVPDSAAPFIEQSINKSLFTGNDLIPGHMLKADSDMQYVEYTSDTARILGDMVPLVSETSDFASPIIIDNYIKSWTGSHGDYALSVLDAALKKSGIRPDITRPDIEDPTPTLSDDPFDKAFVIRFPSRNTSDISEFYNEAEKMEGTFSNISLAKARGDMDEIEEQVLRISERGIIKLNGIRRSISMQSGAIAKIKLDPEMSADEKRQLIDMYYLQMNFAAKEGLRLVDESRAAAKELQKQIKEKDK